MQKNYWLRGGVSLTTLVILYLVAQDFIYHPPTAGLHQMGCNIWYDAERYSFSSYRQCLEESWTILVPLFISVGLVAFVAGSIMGYTYGKINNLRQEGKIMK